MLSRLTDICTLHTIQHQIQRLIWQAALPSYSLLPYNTRLNVVDNHQLASHCALQYLISLEMAEIFEVPQRINDLPTRIFAYFSGIIRYQTGND